MTHAPHDERPDIDWDALTFTPTDELDDDQRWSTWSSVDAVLAHGPRPYPHWVVTDDAAIDTELGVLKTGKEADVFLLERAVPDDPSRHSLLAAKRYRSTDHRLFTRDGDYTAGRKVPVRAGRARRAMEKKTSFGREVAAGLWAHAEFTSLKSAYEWGVPVPYPVQIDDTEILMEYISLDGAAAPRLAESRAGDERLAGWFDQVREAMATLARHQVAHGDLSAYNILTQGERVVIIDMPQVVDIVANPQGVEFLHRDCRNIADWFTSKGYAVDADALLADLLAQAW